MLPITDDDWVHPCHGVYTMGMRSAPIRLMGIDWCPYCGEPCPRLQREIDARAAHMLKAEGNEASDCEPRLL